MVKQALPAKITYFRSPAELRKWLLANHAKVDELWVGFHKKAPASRASRGRVRGRALCVGWIDGIRKGIDAERYVIRFTPRRKGSIWSAVNMKRVEALTKEKRMRPTGLKAFEARIANKSGIYAYEQRRAELEEPYNGVLRKNKAAWDFFYAQPPSYRKVIGWWINSAKQEETRVKRLTTLIDASVAGKRLR
jgi:uncharacterized protein YdeI (YjbR/CyaY-like superfamily)